MRDALSSVHWPPALRKGRGEENEFSRRTTVERHSGGRCPYSLGRLAAALKLVGPVRLCLHTRPDQGKEGQAKARQRTKPRHKKSS